jgi:hypothetical protein
LLQGWRYEVRMGGIGGEIGKDVGITGVQEMRLRLTSQFR